jgi:hypothetical protein
MFCAADLTAPGPTFGECPYKSAIYAPLSPIALLGSIGRAQTGSRSAVSRRPAAGRRGTRGCRLVPNGTAVRGAADDHRGPRSGASAGAGAVGRHFRAQGGYHVAIDTGAWADSAQTLPGGHRIPITDSDMPMPNRREHIRTPCGLGCAHPTRAFAPKHGAKARRRAPGVGGGPPTPVAEPSAAGRGCVT